MLTTPSVCKTHPPGDFSGPGPTEWQPGRSQPVREGWSRGLWGSRAGGRREGGGWEAEVEGEEQGDDLW